MFQKKELKTHRLGDLQLKILSVLWERSEATVAQMHEALAPESDLAYTTVSTMLAKMEKRGLVAHRNEGRTFVYRAAVEAGEVTRSMADHLVDSLFAGSLENAVSHLLTTRQVSQAELGRLEKLIAEKKRRAK